MEMRLLFTEFIFAFCAVVMADRTYGFSQRFTAAWRRKTPAAPAPRPALSTGPACDWYVHFYRSDLTGDVSCPARPQTPQPRPKAPAAPAQRRRDDRPRLRA